MAEFNTIIPDFELYVELPSPIEKPVEFISTNNDFFPIGVPQELNVNFIFTTNDTPTRMTKTYGEYRIIPIYYHLGDESEEGTSFTKEVREWDLVLPFGDGASSPRRQPTELIYKGRKMKNTFPTE